MKTAPVAIGGSALSGQYNALRDDAKGGGTILPHQQLGVLALSTNPSNTQTVTLTINGSAIVFTFVTTIGTTAGNVLIGADAATSAANLLALLQNPWLTTTKGVALALADQKLIGYVGYALPAGGTTITPFSLNNSTSAPLTSFTGSTTVTGGSWTANTLKLFVEAGVFYIGTTKVNFLGGSSPAFVAPTTSPRIDILTIDTAGTLAITQGTEAASPVAPAYPFGKVVICEVRNVVGETSIYDNQNQQSGQGFVSLDARPFNSIIFINDPNQIQDAVITNAKLSAAVGIIQAGMIMMWGTKSAPTGWALCDGAAISRTTFAALFGLIAPTIGTFTVTIASPAVFSLTAHGLATGDAVYFTTTGALPTGLSANTIYYVISAGLTADAFEVSTTRGGAAVNTSGSQSGTHTAVNCPYGLGDGSTTFNVPDMRGNVPVGLKGADADFGNLGKTGGEKTHVLTVAELASHSHVLRTDNNYRATGGPQNYVYPGAANVLGSTDAAGSDNAHNNIQPFNTVNYIIKT